MTHHEIVTRLSLICPSNEVIWELTMSTIFYELVRRYGQEALTLSLADLRLCRDEVLIAIDHGLDIRDFVSQGVDAWMIIRNL